MGHHGARSRRGAASGPDLGGPAWGEQRGEPRWEQHRGGHRHGERGDGAEWGPPWARGGSRGPGGPGGGPPPWLVGLFGGRRPEPGGGPRVRRGDVRSAILDVLATAARDEEPINGYQVISKIAERTDDAWKPSPGSVYPTISQLQDEGLVEADDERGRRTVRLTAEGLAHVEEHAEQLAAVWTPFAAREDDEKQAGLGDLKPEIGQVMSAVWQILSTGSSAQRSAAVEILIDARRKLYGVLADGPDGTDGDDGDDGESDAPGAPDTGAGRSEA